MDSLQSFLEHYTLQTYERGDVILQQDSEPAYAYVVKKGTIKTYNLTPRGEEKPVGFAVRNEFFPLGWIFNKIYKTQYYYEALSECELFAIPRDELQNFLDTNRKAMKYVLDKLVWDRLSAEMRINALGQSRASEKVLHTIHYLALCFGRDLQTDIVEIPLPLTQQDVANFTGLTRETISSELKKLASREVIFSRNRNYVVLTDRLNELLDDEYDHRFIRKM